MCLCTAGRMRWSRSLENPTSSGFESVNVAPGAGTTRTAHSIAAAIDFKLEGIASLLYGPDCQLFYSDCRQAQRTVSHFRSVTRTRKKGDRHLISDSCLSPS